MIANLLIVRAWAVNLVPAFFGKRRLRSLWLTTHLLLIGSIAFGVQEQRKLTLSANNITIQKVFQTIKKRTGLTVFYSNELLNDREKVSVDFKDADLSRVLDYILEGKNISYEIRREKVIVLSKNEHGKTTKIKLPQPAPIVESIWIKGRVTDEKGEGLPGVSILVKGTQQGMASDADGGFSIEVPDENAVLVFSFVGYLSEEVSVKSKSSIDVSMEVDKKSLEEVVVVGYGTKSKKELIGAIGSLSADAIKEQAVSGFDQAMAGRIAGVQVIQNSGAPGAQSSIRIRGVGTPGNSQPLFVFDGVPMFDNSVANMINPNDIASIEVLKDASAAAIYGARAANGIVLITTKQGASGKPKIDLNYYTGVQTFENRIEMLNAEEYKNLLRERNSPFSISNADVNWFDEMTSSALMHNLNFNVRGGDANTVYFTSIDYFDQDGIVKGTDFNRITGRFNIQTKIGSKLKIGANIMLGKHAMKTRSESSIYSTLGQALMYPPIVPVRESTGQYGDASEYVSILNNTNPMAMAEVGSYKTGRVNALANFFAEYKIIKGLEYKVNFGVNFNNNVSDNYFPGYVFGLKDRQQGNPYVNKTISNSKSWVIENLLTYKLTLHTNHQLSLLAGSTFQEEESESLYGARLNEVSKNKNLISISSSPSVVQRANGGFYSTAIASFLGRLEYGYKSKYLFAASIRRDGSSKFAPGRRWGTFPSVSAGWNISDESFFRSRMITNLKVRASWGRLGNEQIEGFQYLSTLGSVSYLLNGTTVAGVFPNNVANLGITWETSEQSDVGLDLSMFGNRLNIGVDYYNKLTKNILLTDPISSIYGYTNASGDVINATKNTGVVLNRGIEFSSGFRSRGEKIRWSVDANLTTLRNSVVSLGSGAPIINDLNNGLYYTRTDVGSQIGAFYGKVVDGLTENGNFLFRKDSNGNDIQTIIGNPIPKLTYGMNGNVSWGNVDLSLSLQGVSGNDIFATTLYATGNSSYSTNNQIRKIYNEAGKSAPRIASATGADYVGSSWYVYDGDFLRLRSIQLGYNLSITQLKHWGIEKCRIYILGQNVYTFDKYTVGLNPEVGSSNNTSSGVDMGTYPAPRIFSIGLNLTF